MICPVNTSHFVSPTPTRRVALIIWSALLLGVIVFTAVATYVGPRGFWGRNDELAKNLRSRMLDAAQYLADHIHEAPVWIVPCMQGASPTRTAGSSIYPAVQNMLLAARALGLGATLTTLYLNFEKEVEAALGLPSDVHSYALIPIGYPVGRFGPVRRVPLVDVVYADRWGQPYRDS